MYTNHLGIPDYQITNLPEYVNISKKCINNLVNGIVKCAPLITAVITIGTLFSLIEEVSTRYIPYDQLVTSSTTVFVPDDVKIVPIPKAVWIHVINSPRGLILRKCKWNNFFCSRPF